MAPNPPAARASEAGARQGNPARAMPAGVGAPTWAARPGWVRVGRCPVQVVGWPGVRVSMMMRASMASGSVPVRGGRASPVQVKGTSRSGLRAWVVAKATNRGPASSGSMYRSSMVAARSGVGAVTARTQMSSSMRVGATWGTIHTGAA
ncbi:Hypothetical protein PFR_JS25-2_45 [Propionibacterium freudenreichii]|nr:Hypothetical protein PFR_JS25-2_45 [Propionibacterium freudenreichii]